MSGPLTVALLPMDEAGCGGYRLIQPFSVLAQRGLVIPIGMKVGEGRFALTTQMAETADVVVIQRSGGKDPGSDLTELVKQYGHKTVYELDDDLETVTKDNPAWFEVLRLDPDYPRRAMAIAKQCRMISTSTEPLAALLRRRTGRVVRVVPNGVDLKAWRPEGWARPSKPEDEPIRIGYIASRNHVEDARLLVKPWRAIAREFPSTKFILAGGFYPCLREAVGDALEYHPWAPMHLFPAACRSLRLDIACAPLVDSTFARSKSNVKYLEAAAMGIPMVASDVEPYRGTTALLAKTTDQFTAHLRDLVRSRELRVSEVERADAWVKANGTADRSADRWLDVCREVVKANAKPTDTTAVDVTLEGGKWTDNLSQSQQP